MRRLWRHARRLCRERCAIAALEFALLAPILVSLVLGIIEIGRYMWITNTIQQAVFEGGRLAMLDPDPDLDAIRGSVAAELDAAASVAVSTETTSGVTYLTIGVSQTHRLIIPLTPVPDLTIAISNRVPLPAG